MAFARGFNVSISTIQSLAQRQRETGQLADRARSGRPRMSTAREDRALVRMSAVNPRLVVRALRQRWRTTYGAQASASTLGWGLIAVGLRGRVAARKPLLTARHRQVRLQWARERLHWTAADWHRCFLLMKRQ